MKGLWVYILPNPFRSAVFFGLSAFMLSIVAPAISGTKGYSVFHIGNSLTDETYGFHDAAASLGHTDVAWGRSMIPGCPIWLHWQDKHSGGRINRRVAPLTQSNPAPLSGWIGPYLESTPIDVLVLQVFWANGDSYINRYARPNLHHETIEALIGFAGLVYKANPQCRVFLYASHTMDIGTVDNTLDDPTINYKALMDTVNNTYPGNPPVSIIPVPLAFNAMLAQGGEAAQLWSDGHANHNGEYLIQMLFYSVIYRADCAGARPTGNAVSAKLPNVSADFAAKAQKVAWDVARQYKYSGVTGGSVAALRPAVVGHSPIIHGATPQRGYTLLGRSNFSHLPTAWNLAVFRDHKNPTLVLRAPR